jgi:Carboxypeptidase regulatory-like domain
MELMTVGVRFAFVLLALTAARDAQACSCMDSGPPCQSYFTAQAVFAGTVRSITPIGPQPAYGDAVRVEFDDVVTYRGEGGTTQSVVTAANGASCGFEFMRGERYVVYASAAKTEASLSTWSCSRTRHVADAADDLVFFETLSAAATGPRVFGAVTHTETGLVRHETRDLGPVPNLRLTLRSSTATHEARTDASGRYEFNGLVPERYQLTVERSSELVPYERPEQIVNLTDRRGCAERNFIVHFDGRVDGTVIDRSGDPVANIRVQMMPFEQVHSRDAPDTIGATTDAAGRFEFTELTPGRYVAGVDLFRILELLPDPTVAFPVTYHPGTPDSLYATVIDMRGGERHDLAPMTIAPALRQRQLKGTVRFEDGTPAAGARVILGDSLRIWHALAQPVETDSSGTFSFLVHEGLSYVVSATYGDRRILGRRPTPTTVGPFVVTPQTSPVQIFVSRP